MRRQQVVGGIRWRWAAMWQAATAMWQAARLASALELPVRSMACTS